MPLDAPAPDSVTRQRAAGGSVLPVNGPGKVMLRRRSGLPARRIASGNTPTDTWTSTNVQSVQLSAAVSQNGTECRGV